MVQSDRLKQGDSEVGLGLVDLALEACEFLLAHDWCGLVDRLYFDRGFPKVAVFYAEITPLRNADPAYWVIVGDVPPIYIDTIGSKNGAEALETYVMIFDDLLSAYTNGESLEGHPPLLSQESFIPLQMTRKLADMLSSRLEFIERMIVELWDEEVRFDLALQEP